MDTKTILSKDIYTILYRKNIHLFKLNELLCYFGVTRDIEKVISEIPKKEYKIIKGMHFVTQQAVYDILINEECLSENAFNIKFNIVRENISKTLSLVLQERIRENKY